MIDLRLGDCLAILPTLEAGSVDAVVTDPPYGLEFMGKDWDSFRVPGKKPRVNPGTYEKMSKHGRPSGWSANGNPSCLNCGGDKYRKGERKCVCDSPLFPNHSAMHNRCFQEWSQGWAVECFRVMKPGSYLMAFGGTRTFHRLICAIEDAGFEIRDCLNWLYGSGFPKGRGCLKPAWEPITLARKPGGKIKPLGIEECRVEANDKDMRIRSSEHMEGGRFGATSGEPSRTIGHQEDSGRWPPNVLLQHHPECNGECRPECVVRMLGEQSGQTRPGYFSGMDRKGLGYQGADRSNDQWQNPSTPVGDSGTAARFYPQFRYAAKASRRERGPDNTHPTVKPLAVMEWLVKLACPEGGVVLDPFMGSGSTACACKRNGRSFIGIENDAQWIPIAEKRIEAEQAKMSLFAGISD